MSFVQTHAEICPHCGEPIELVLDTSVESQSYVEDCEVCCRPIVVRVSSGLDGDAIVAVSRENE